MDLDSLRCFSAAAATLNFRAAAGRVALSPGAFSDRIAGLEEELGVALFVRSTRQVRLTDAGTRLLAHARTVIEQADRCREVALGTGRPAPYELTVGTRFELGQSWLCPALGPLRAARPERTVHLYVGDGPDLLARVERGALDAAVLSARLPSARLDYATLHAEDYVFVGTDPCVGGPADAHRVALLDVSPDLPLFRYLLDALPDGAPWRFAGNEYLGAIGNIRQRVLAGAGVAVLPEYFVRADLAAGRMRQLMPELCLRSDAFRLVWRAGHPLADRLLGLADELRELPLA